MDEWTVGKMEGTHPSNYPSFHPRLLNHLRNEKMRKHDNELNLYKKTLQLTQDIAQAVSDAETAYVLKLLKRRRILFNQINELKQTSGELNEEASQSVAELQTVIKKIIKLDNDIKDKMAANAKATREELEQLRNGQKLTSIYCHPISHTPSKFVNKSIG